MRLSDLADGRENNFNLIRIIAALAVLVSHSFPLALGTGTSEPVGRYLGISLGTLAVDVFFITSGFLVTSSLLNRQRTLEFLWARTLRIFPGHLVMLLLVVFLLGASFTTLSVPDYLTSKAIYGYLAKCGILIAGVTYELPGVFDRNPLPHAVNGSLWSMPFELRMYLILALVWTALGIARRFRDPGFGLVMVVFAAASGLFVIADHFWFHASRQFAHLFFMFFVGGAFYVSRGRVHLSGAVFLACAIALLVSSVNKQAFFVAYICLLPYVLLFLAYVPAGLVRRYNRLGDYSYGTYIYAFPVQQSVVALIPGVSVFQLIAIAGTATTLISMLSWHLIEKRALGFKELFIGAGQPGRTVHLHSDGAAQD
jgi:peptidoglycan/LPS O-acetylase OafA/YrhL